MPGPVPYDRRPGEAARDAEVAARVQAARDAAATRRTDDDLPQTGVHAPDPFDAYDAAEAAQWDNLPYPRPRADRCETCGYRTDATGHTRECGAAP